MKSQRYFFCSNKYRKRKVFDFHNYISENSTEYNNTEFLYMFCLQRESFLKLVDLIKDDTIFESRPFKQARPVQHQLLVFLHRIGCEGVAASLNVMSTFFKIGKGSIRNYILNWIKAILKLKKNCYLLAISDGTWINEVKTYVDRIQGLYWYYWWNNDISSPKTKLAFWMLLF